MAVTGLQRPDFRTISDFRKRHLPALAALFVQVLRLCRQAGLVKLGHVALDGTKLKANASKHKAMSYGRMTIGRGGARGRGPGWLAQAAGRDAAEDAEHGPETGAATSCRTGSPTNRRGWSASARPRQRSRPRRGLSRRATPSPAPSSGMVDHAAGRAAARRGQRRPQSPKRRVRRRGRSATSPTPTAGS